MRGTGDGTSHGRPWVYMGFMGFRFLLIFGGWDDCNLSRCWSHEISSFVDVELPILLGTVEQHSKLLCREKTCALTELCPRKLNTHMAKARRKLRKRQIEKHPRESFQTSGFIKSDGHVPIHGDVYVSNYKGFLSKFAWKNPLESSAKASRKLRKSTSLNFDPNPSP